jgi:hypothetical protein
MIIIDMDFAISKTDMIKTDRGTGHVYDIAHAWSLLFLDSTGFEG